MVNEHRTDRQLVKVGTYGIHLCGINLVQNTTNI